MSHAQLPTEPALVAMSAAETPWDLLHACHERVDRTLTLLLRLHEHVLANGADRDAREAAIDVMRYFDLAAPEHHRDEESHVFPVLLADVSGVWNVLVETLLAQHRQMEQAWQVLRHELVRLVEASCNTDTSLFRWAADTEARLTAFAGLYAEHIALEDGQAYPACVPRMSRASQVVMLADMRLRRQQTTGLPSLGISGTSLGRPVKLPLHLLPRFIPPPRGISHES